MAKTNYVIAMDYAGEHYLEELYLLGWNNREDWYDTLVDSYDIIGDDDTVLPNNDGLLFVDKDTAAYVGETYEQLVDYCNDAIKEGYDCTILEIKYNDAGVPVVFPVE